MKKLNQYIMSSVLLSASIPKYVIDNSVLVFMTQKVPGYSSILQKCQPLTTILFNLSRRVKSTQQTDAKKDYPYSL